MMPRLRVLKVTLSALIVVFGVWSTVAADAAGPEVVNQATNAAACLGGYSPEFRIGGQVNYPKTYTLDLLEGHSSKTVVRDVFTGPAHLRYHRLILCFGGPA